MTSPRLYHWMAINYRKEGLDHYGDFYERPVLVLGPTDLKGAIFWDEGPTRFHLSPKQDAYVVKNYGACIRGFSKWQAEQLFIMDFPPLPIQTNEIQSGGIISPDGYWYAARDGNYTKLYHELVMLALARTREMFTVFPEDEIKLYESETYMRSIGWMTIHHSHIGVDMKPTVQQIERLHQIVVPDNLKASWEQEKEWFLKHWYNIIK